MSLPVLWTPKKTSISSTADILRSLGLGGMHSASDFNLFGGAAQVSPKTDHSDWMVDVAVDAYQAQRQAREMRKNMVPEVSPHIDGPESENKPNHSIWSSP